MPDGRNITVVLSLVVGVSLLLLGATWKYWHSPQMLWSRAQATEYTDAWRALKIATTTGLRGPDPKDPKYIAAKERYESIKAKLDHAIAINDYTGTALAAVGAVVIAISAWLYWSWNQQRTTVNAD